jgi:putative sugar O-methyltransferase
MKALESYMKALERIRISGDLGSFKSDDDYRSVLEHVSPLDGSKYMNLIASTTDITLSEVVEFCKLNDSIGNPIKNQYDGLVCSPSNLRYIFHAFLILKHIKNINRNNLDIVEVGGGYGGLCLAIHTFAKKYNISINSYTIIDLAEANVVQKMFLHQVQPSLKVEWADANTFGSSVERSNMFLISNYCFSEICKEYQERYIQTLFPKVSNGFMAWNGIPIYDFGFDMKYEEEYPKTGDFNLYVYF